MASKNPYFYRKFLIITIDLIAIIWLIHEAFIREVDDFWWLILMPFIVVTAIYNLYAMLLVRYFFNKGRIRLYIEGLYVLLAISPIFVIWYITR
jgi:hypothetical protein